MSGLRWTTVIGNAWNSVMTSAVLQLLKDSGMNMEGIERYIRGDDSAIFTNNAAQATLIAQGYSDIGVIGGTGKYSVRRHEMEFLRTWFDERCHGYQQEQ